MKTSKINHIRLRVYRKRVHTVHMIIRTVSLMNKDDVIKLEIVNKNQERILKVKRRI